MKLSIRFLAFLCLVWPLKIVTGFVIAPPWANQVSNPCSSKSWQLLYWPQTKKCYQIFQRGPCPRSQELAFNKDTKLPECRCPKDLLLWPATNRCYPEFSKGPCEANQYLEKNPITEQVQCSDVKRCDNGWIFWPSLKKCFQLYTQGPCHKGDLLIMNPLTAEPYCGCDPLLLRQYYFPPLNLCYEHFTKGPCEAGLLFAYNHTSESTHCMCSRELSNYHLPSQQCFQFETKGPCGNGQVFTLDQSTGFGHCSCRSNYVKWIEDGSCYKAFTPGPCEDDQFIIPESDGSSVGKCERNPCPRAHLYFPDGPGDSVKCHKVGSRGPCPLGQLVVFEKYSGKSYRGECGCSPGYNQNYWPDTAMCYEWGTRGPCNHSFLFHYNKEMGKTECICDESQGFIFWNETSQCYRVYTQGPCPANAWLLPGDSLNDVFCECVDGWVFDETSYTCVQEPEAQPLLGWSQLGTFVRPGHTGIAKRVQVNQVGWKRRPLTHANQAQALPRVARSSRRQTRLH